MKAAEKPLEAGKAKTAYPTEFEAAWKAYPHVRGRSSKPNALACWRKLPPGERANLVGAIGQMKLKVRDIYRDAGAPDMARWLKDAKHLDWMDDADGADPVKPEVWPFYVAMWQRGEGWPPSAGPAPDQPGTLVPPHLLKADAVLPELH
ncbi:hypothetical protein ACFPIF_11605 [Brevundimonas faecalis]|uniref:hypothetical protein n=1 Tax=Brevundimonas faecalis TaxID=947378 RepID=UPI00361D61F0